MRIRRKSLRANIGIYRGNAAIYASIRDNTLGIRKNPRHGEQGSVPTCKHGNTRIYGSIRDNTLGMRKNPLIYANIRLYTLIYANIRYYALIYVNIQ